MTRIFDINPVTRIEGHAKVHIEIGDQGDVQAAYLHILEFRGFERFVQGMQVELMPTLTTRICGTCPHAHHLVGAKTVDRVFGVTPPRAGVMLRELLNCGSMIHSHAIHFFALAGPDLLLGLNAPAAQRNIIGLLAAAPDLAGKALRLRSLGQKICEIVGGRGTHPVAAVAGGMAMALTTESRATLIKMAAEALELAKVAVEAGKGALAKNQDLLSLFPLPVHNMGTVSGTALALYDGTLRVRRPDGSVALDFEAADYRKQVFVRDPVGEPAAYRVGALARVNAADTLDTPLAAQELAGFKETWGSPCDYTVMNHYARLIELLHCAEKAVKLLADNAIASPEVKAKITATPTSATAHIEAPRGVLIHDYEVDANGIMQGANFIVATQHNISAINATIQAAAAQFLSQPDAELLNGVEFAIRCYDPCLSCSTHQLGGMPLDVTIAQNGQVVRSLRR
jgi:coenzyme F420-reducing hydrogenase alpha subunit